MNQETWEEPQIAEVLARNESHIALVLVLDISGSMMGLKIEEVMTGLETFYSMVSSDDALRERLEVMIITFNDSAKIIQPFLPGERLRPVGLSAGGGTNYCMPIFTAMDEADKRARIQYNAGAVPYKPWLMLISDGAPNDPPEELAVLAQEIHEWEARGKGRFFSLGVEGSDFRTFHSFSDKVMRLKGHDFRSFFTWLYQSFRVQSQTPLGSPMAAVPLPTDVDKDTTAWFA
jgi:uncharacterized protein YegL